MKIRIRSVLAGTAALAVAAGIVVGGGTAAFAATTPPWEPDPNQIGTISFYDAAGNPITGGDISSKPAAFYAVASGPGRSGDTTAQLSLATPKQGQPTNTWDQFPMTGSTAYPNPSAPANIKNLTVPVATGTTGDLSIAEYIDTIPNTITDPTYANLYEFRLATAGPSGASAVYFRVDILVTITGTAPSGLKTGSWSVAYPAPATVTNTSLVANKTSPQPSGSAITLTATVNPKAAGSVHFFDGATEVTGGTYDPTTGVATLTTTPSDGPHTYQAQFVSSDPAFTGSTSNNLPFSITPAGTPTSVDLVATPPSPQTADAAGNVSVTLTSHTGPAGTAGVVHFFDGNTEIGTGTVAANTATLATTLNTAGSPHLLTATFIPTSATFAQSTSLAVTYYVNPANFGQAGVPVTANDTTAPFAGTLALQVAPGTKVDLTQIPVNSPGGHPATDALGHRHAYVFTGNLTGVAVQDTRPPQQGWTVTGQATDFVGPVAITAKNLGWEPALATGGDAEGTITPGTTVDPMLKTPTSTGLATTRNLAVAAPGNGLGTQNLKAGVTFWIPDTSPAGTYTSTLTLTLISP